MKIVNLKDLKVEEFSGDATYKVLSVNLPDLNLPFTDFDSALTCMIYSLLNLHIQPDIDHNAPIVFDFHITNFDGDEIDFQTITDCILSIFSQWFVDTKERRAREYRFGLPEAFTSIADTQLHLMKMINYETRFDLFSIYIRTSKTEYQFEYLGGE